MSHNHCEQEHGDHDGHNHDHPDDNGSNIFSKIDLSNTVVLNASVETPSKVFKPWNKRFDEEIYIESDLDDQLILRVPFTASVKLNAILLKAGPGDQTPASLSVFANDDNLDFSEAADKTPTQSFQVVQNRDVGTYTVKPAKFSNISSISLFFPSSQGADILRLYYIGFKGSWSERNNNPVVTVYEASPNIADHEKIQGTGDMTFNSLGQ